MSTINIETNGNVITIFGPDLTDDFEQMKRDCCGRYGNFILGDAQKLVGSLREQGCSPMTEKDVEILDCLGRGVTYYDDVYCYYCFNNKNYRNYMFSPDDAENREKEYKRLRMGVVKFSQEEDFEVWIVPCAKQTESAGL
jgi:hypothetical protein